MWVRHQTMLQGTLASRGVVPTLHGLESPGLGGATDGIVALVAGLLPGMSGRQAADTFATTAASLEAAEVQRAQQKRLALLGGTTVTVMGLGILTYFLVRR